MAQLDKFDLNFCVRRLPKKLFDLMKEDRWQGKIFVGGGYIRGVVGNETINDIDLFVTVKSDAELLANQLAFNKNDIYKTDNAYTIRDRIPIQIINRWVFDKPEDVAKSFDFTVCCAVIYFEGTKVSGQWKSFCDDRFYIDLANKRLVYRSPERNEDAGGSMLRVLKYYQRGYRIPLDSLGRVIARLESGVDLLRVEESTKADGTTREERLAKVITGLLREVDPNIDVNHLSHLPSSTEELL